MIKLLFILPILFLAACGNDSRDFRKYSKAWTEERYYKCDGEWVPKNVTVRWVYIYRQHWGMYTEQEVQGGGC